MKPMLILLMVLFSAQGNEIEKNRQTIKTAEKALEKQLICESNIDPVLTIRTLLEKHFLVETEWGADGIPVFKPKYDMYVFGKKVIYISGWGLDDDEVLREPFTRAPGTAPPRHLSVSIQTNIKALKYKEKKYIEDSNSFSSIEKGNQNFANSNINHSVTITCYDESKNN